MEHYNLDITKQSITIEGVTYYPSDFQLKRELSFTTKSDIYKDLYLFLVDWFDTKPTIKVQTSGSTGTPKVLELEKEQMMQSALLTCSFLKLKRNDKALLCMHLKYIGAKMLVVRSLIAGLNLYAVNPDGNPLKYTSQSLDFAAMVPLQVYNAVNDITTKEKINNIKHLIIGGGAIDSTLLEKLQNFNTNIYSTYGMTETLSHIALRKLNGKNRSDYYTPFGNIKLSKSEDDTLIIEAPSISKDILKTNDIVEFIDKKHFKIIGRKDNIINSGGIKIQIEQVEELLKPHFTQHFAISSVKDEKLGEKLVLVIEGDNIPTIDFETLLPKYHIPKHIVNIKKIPTAGNNKIDRKTLKDILSNLAL